MTNLKRVLTCVPAFAAVLALANLPAAAALPSTSAGLINPNGTVAVGTGFTVSHPHSGTYIITYPTSTGFTSFPIMTVTPFGVDGHVVTGIISSEGGANGGATFTINMTDRVNRLLLEDNGFSFTLIAS